MKTFYFFLSICDRILMKKQVLRILLFSLVLVGFSDVKVRACTSSYSEQYILLKQEPKYLHRATFMGFVDITKVTRIENKNQIVVRGTLLESKTHPQFVNKKIAFIYYQNSCGPYINEGSSGFALGKVLQPDTNFLIVNPYSIRGMYVEEENFSLTWSEIRRMEEEGYLQEGEVLTLPGNVPLWKFYLPDSDL